MDNSPNKLTKRDFAKAQCKVSRLKIHNSPSNLYFYARFIACAQATTRYCFIQDDDYIIWPEIVNALHSQISKSDGSTGIHLLPPQEKLFSHLWTMRKGSNIHTSFAWLGYGTIVPQSHVAEFLDVLNFLNATDEELKMADNYFTILSNTFAETWFDQGVELGGGHPFTVGVEGDERNRRHIITAVQMLESIAGCAHPPCIDPPSLILPYVNIGSQLDPLHVSRAPCLGSTCLLETSIDLLPNDVTPFALATDHVLAQEAINAALIDDNRRNHYLNHPPSYAVDGRPETAFCSFQKAKAGDVISLDTLGQPDSEWISVELVFLVDLSTEEILRASIFEIGVEGSWVVSQDELSCNDSIIALPQNAGGFLRECSIQMLPATCVHNYASVFRVRLGGTTERSWCVHEVWLRGSRKESLKWTKKWTPSWNLLSRRG